MFGPSQQEVNAALARARREGKTGQVAVGYAWGTYWLDVGSGRYFALAWKLFLGVIGVLALVGLLSRLK